VTLEREFFNDNLLVRIHVIIMMIRWTGLASWEFEFLFSGSLTSTFLLTLDPVPFKLLHVNDDGYRDTSLIRNRHPP